MLIPHQTAYKLQYPKVTVPVSYTHLDVYKRQGYIEIDTIKKQIRGYNPVHRIYQGWGAPAGYNGYFVIRCV